MSCLHAGKKWPSGRKKGAEEVRTYKALRVRKQFKCFVGWWRAGRPWEDITATFLDLYLTNVTLDSARGAKRGQIAAVCGAPLLLLLLFTRLLQIVQRAGSQWNPRQPKWREQGCGEWERRRWVGTRDLSASLDAGHNFCRLNCAAAFCLFAMPCAGVIYRPGPYRATLGPCRPALGPEQ